MLGELLESRARRQRRTGGAMLSVALHIAIIGAATAATVRGSPPEKTTPKVDVIHFASPPAPTPVERPPAVATSPATRSRNPVAPTVITLNIVAPTIVPPSLPAINPSADSTPDVFARSPRGTGSTTGNRAGIPDLTADAPSSSDWRRGEAMMHILSSAKPRYPEALRQTGVSGRVLVQFTVDTLGRVDMNSVRALSSTHELFTQAVRTALSSFRFKPAEVGGRRVAALAEMPFEFELRR